MGLSSFRDTEKIARAAASFPWPLAPDPWPLLIFADPEHERRARPLLRRLPPMQGAPIRIERVAGLRDRRGAVHGGAFLRERRIALDCTANEFPRIFLHELFHFVWVRAGNPARRGFEKLLEAEWRAGAAGELGWSAEWRKQALQARDIASRTRKWREYCCESFCDTGAWLYSGVRRHSEFTLPEDFRQRRRIWFQKSGELSV